ncbi:MAG: cyclic nucleotide-binding domain-containing protein [Armatimonadetes bacterium]|nr:cyclic nucleotide-binding domain-containing protein [Armatimonadota bacterium]
MVTESELAGCHMFDGLPEDVVAPVSGIAKVRRYTAGEVIFAERARAEKIHILRHGRVALSFPFPYHGETLRVAITSIGPGEVFGWSALTRGRRFTAQAVAEEDSEVLNLPGDALRELMDRDPRLGYAIMSYLTDLASHRLRDSWERLRVMLQM